MKSVALLLKYKIKLLFAAYITTWVFFLNISLKAFYYFSI